MNSKNYLSLKNSMITTTLRCTLNCKYCSAYVPLIKPSIHYSLDELIASTNKYFKIVDHVDNFTITGGEPFLHAELGEFIDFLATKSSKVGKFTLITNGTLLPSKKLLQSLIKNKKLITILIDDYGSELSVNVNKLKELCEENNLNFNIRNYHKSNAYCDGWVDVWDNEKKHFTEKEIIDKYQKCLTAQNMNFCFIIKGSQVHPCGPSHHFMATNIIPVNHGEYIDLDDTSATVEMQKNKFKNILSCKYLSACAYCNGICKDSIRVAPAQQI